MGQEVLEEEDEHCREKGQGPGVATGVGGGRRIGKGVKENGGTEKDGRIPVRGEGTKSGGIGSGKTKAEPSWQRSGSVLTIRGARMELWDPLIWIP